MKNIKIKLSFLKFLFEGLNQNAVPALLLG